MDEESDEATVVIDFNSIKDELNKDELDVFFDKDFKFLSFGFELLAFLVILEVIWLIAWTSVKSMSPLGSESFLLA